MNPWQQPGQPSWGPPPPTSPQQPYPQPGYGQPQQPYPTQGYPGYQQPGYQYPYPYTYPYPAAQPAGGGTAVTTIVMSVILALSQSLAALGYFAKSSELSSGGAREAWVPGFLQFQGSVRLVAAAALFAGAVLMMRRSAAGRWVLAATSGTIVAAHILDMAAVSNSQPGPSSTPAGTLAGLILPIACLVLVLTPSTRRWLEAGRLRR